mgnify:FL=1|tara:strand:+ start:427 stop:561 length:135 start_codon:yes stop_codon:yes gene_type:complete
MRFIVIKTFTAKHFDSLYKKGEIVDLQEGSLTTLWQKLKLIRKL